MVSSTAVLGTTCPTDRPSSRTLPVSGTTTAAARCAIFVYRSGGFTLTAGRFALSALRQALREREQDGLRLAELRTQRRPPTPPGGADVPVLEGACMTLAEIRRAGARALFVGVLTGASVRQVPRECRRVLSLIHERCDNCTRTAWATFERESGRVW